jgi:hypothetical protein
MGPIDSYHLQIHASWIPDEDTCAITDIHTTKLNMTATLITDIVLLLIMLSGLLRLGFNEPGVYGLGRLMWKQVCPRFAHVVMFAMP